MSIEDAQKRIERLTNSAPDVVKLARALSLAVRIEPELMRAMRLCILPQSDVGVEAEFWFSDLVELRNPLMCKLFDDVIAAFRLQWANHPELRIMAWEVISRVHLGGPELIRLEEEIGWHLLNDTPADFVDSILRRLLVSMIDQERMGIAQWAVQALPRLPDKIFEHELGRAMYLGARDRVGMGRFTQGQASQAIDPKLLAWVLPKITKTIEFYVRLSEQAIEFSPLRIPDARPIPLPDTTPLEILLEFLPKTDQPSQRFILSTRELNSFPIPPNSTVQITDANGNQQIFKRHEIEELIAPWITAYSRPGLGEQILFWIIDDQCALGGIVKANSVVFDMPAQLELSFEWLPTKPKIPARHLAVGQFSVTHGSFEIQWILLHLDEPLPAGARPVLINVTNLTSESTVFAITNLVPKRWSYPFIATNIEISRTGWGLIPVDKSKSALVSMFAEPVVDLLTGSVQGVVGAPDGNDGSYELERPINLSELFPNHFTVPGSVLILADESDKVIVEQLQSMLEEIMPDGTVQLVLSDANDIAESTISEAKVIVICESSDFVDGPLLDRLGLSRTIVSQKQFVRILLSPTDLSNPGSFDYAAEFSDQALATLQPIERYERLQEIANAIRRVFYETECQSDAHFATETCATGCVRGTIYIY